jgi:hypothetical protein
MQLCDPVCVAPVLPPVAGNISFVSLLLQALLWLGGGGDDDNDSYVNNNDDDCCDSTGP